MNCTIIILLKKKNEVICTIIVLLKKNNVLLINWEELKSYFMVADPASTQNVQYGLRSSKGLTPSFRPLNPIPRKCKKSCWHMGTVCVKEFSMDKEDPWLLRKLILERSSSTRLQSMSLCNRTNWSPKLKSLK